MCICICIRCFLKASTQTANIKLWLNCKELEIMLYTYDIGRFYIADFDYY